MSETVLDVEAIRRPILDHALASGMFDRVGGHEPKSAPGTGVTAAVWVQSFDPVNVSGLDITTARLIFQARVYTSMTAEPQDEIDPDLVTAAGVWLGRLIGDLHLKGPSGEGTGAAVPGIDVRGRQGVKLAGVAGYVEQDGKLMRVYTITIPVLVNDVWQEAR